MFIDFSYYPLIIAKFEVLLCQFVSIFDKTPKKTLYLAQEKKCVCFRAGWRMSYAGPLARPMTSALPCSALRFSQGYPALRGTVARNPRKKGLKDKNLHDWKFFHNIRAI
jgi:hypothetical protein